MADEPKPIAPAKPAAAPDQAAIDAALKEYEAASDRVAVLAKYPFIVKILNSKRK